MKILAIATIIFSLITIVNTNKNNNYINKCSKYNYNNSYNNNKL